MKYVFFEHYHAAALFQFCLNNTFLGGYYVENMYVYKRLNILVRVNFLSMSYTNEINNKRKMTNIVLIWKLIIILRRLKRK